MTRYEDIDRVYTDNAFLSNAGAANFQALIGETFPSIPLGIDPPDHGQYRVFLMPFFSPARLNRMNDQIRARCCESLSTAPVKRRVACRSPNERSAILAAA